MTNQTCASPRVPGHHDWRRTVAFIAIMTLLVAMMPFHVAMAQSADQNWLKQGFSTFMNTLDANLSNVVDPNNPVVRFAKTMWQGFAAILIFWTMMQMAFRGFNFPALFELMMKLLITGILLANYDGLTTAIKNFFMDFGHEVARQILSSNARTQGIDPTQPGSMIDFLSISISDIADPTGNAQMPNPLTQTSAFITAALLSLLGVLALVLFVIMLIISYLVTMWSLWGYAVAKCIGFIFVPLLLFNPLVWLFDGWLKFFIGFCLYAVVVKINLALVLMAFCIFFNQNFDFANSTTAGSIFGMIGMFFFAFIGILALMSSGKFASAMVAGAGGGGLGGSIVSAVRDVSKVTGAGK